MNVSMGARLQDYVDVDAVASRDSSEPMQQYANNVMAIFVERCRDHALDPNRMWLRLDEPEGILRAMYQRSIDVSVAGEQLHYRAVNLIRTKSYYDYS